MSAHDEQRLMLACLVAILRRARGTVVIDEADIERAYNSLEEITWKRNPPTQTLRLSVPLEDDQ
jgi:hypothetical protein